MSTFWDNITGTLGKAVAVVADKTVASWTKEDELRDELAYYKATGQPVANTGLASTTGVTRPGATVAAAPSAVLPMGWMIGGGVALLLVVVLLFTGGRRR
jgi:hypothetical protein